MLIRRRILLYALTWLWACQSSPSKEPEKTEVSIDTSSDAENARVPPHRQLMVVATPGWDEAQGKMICLAWEDEGWSLVGEPIPILIGKKGLAWGIGIDDCRSLPGPKKQEGDLKSPAGVFELGPAFGYANLDQASFIKLDYMSILGSTMCIEDGESEWYNRIVDENHTESDWSSTDHMLRRDDLYEWGIMVAHNYSPAESGAGSCIFVHVWNPKGKGTAGCTSMDKETLKDVLAWIDPEDSPLLIQAPYTELSRFQMQYQLPKTLLSHLSGNAGS